MKFLMSIAWRILPHISVSEILELVTVHDVNNKINGIEIATANYEDMKTALEYTIDKNMIFQCHSPKFKNQEELDRYLKNVDKLARIRNEKINIVFHSLELPIQSEAVIRTKEYMNYVFDFIEKNQLYVTISLENLNYHHEVQRINLDVIDNILIDYQNLYFTYDIGHDIFDNKKATKLTNLQIERINNIHLHNVKNNEDHWLITEKCEIINEIRDAVSHLDEIKYKGTVVLEEGINRYQGENIKEKTIKYIKSFEIIDSTIRK